MCFTGNPGTGKTTVALRMAEILHRLGYVRKGHLVAVTRDDLVGQYIGHTAPKTKEVLKKAMGGVLFIDEAYYLYRPENERDYGQEAIEILLQVMENQRDDLVVILAGYKDRMDTFFQSNPGLSSRIAHHLDFPDYAEDELLQIADRMLGAMHYRCGEGTREAFADYLQRRLQQPHFANARSVRNALDRMRLRQASRLFADRDRVLGADDLATLDPRRHPGQPGVRCASHLNPTTATCRSHHAPVPPLDPDPLPDRRAPPIPRRQRRPERTDPRRLAGLQGHRPHRLVRHPQRQHAGRRHRQRAGRGAEAAGRAEQRDLPAHDRVERAPRRHGQRGDGRAAPDPRGLRSAASTCWCSTRWTAAATSTSTSRWAASSRSCARRRTWWTAGAT